VRGTESVATIEILPKIAYCFRAIVVCGAHSEAALYLTGEFSIVSACAFTANQEVVSVPAQVLRLEVNLNH
jgi:hypothetical protein